MICPHCNIEMGTTYEPYEYRCTKCGYWFDTWTGKEVIFPPPADELDYDEWADEELFSDEPNTYWIDLRGWWGHGDGDE